MSELETRDVKLIQYLNEAYGKERELETALQAHIGMAQRDAYKKRLKDHLKETKGHARQLERRIKQLGGKAEASPAAGGGRRGRGRGADRGEEGGRAGAGPDARRAWPQPRREAHGWSRILNALSSFFWKISYARGASSSGTRWVAKLSTPSGSSSAVTSGIRSSIQRLTLA